MILRLVYMQQKYPKVAYPSATRQVLNNCMFGDSKTKNQRVIIKLIILPAENVHPPSGWPASVKSCL